MNKQKICLCGCARETKGGKYRPGHDQKLRVEIEKAAGGLEELRRIIEKEKEVRINVKE